LLECASKKGSAELLEVLDRVIGMHAEELPATELFDAYTAFYSANARDDVEVRPKILILL